MKQQLLKLKSIPNARQLGGYRAADGRRVRSGLLLRSGALSGASQSDLDRLRGEYALGTVVDLRTPRETAENPDPIIPGVAYHALPVMGEDSGNQQAVVEIYRRFPDEPGKAWVEMVRSGALAQDMYTCFFDCAQSATAFRRFFEILLTQREGAVLWHCTGGKDRAGLAAVLVLSVLGVDEQTILADFALTNEVNRERIACAVSAAKAHTADEAELECVAALAGVSLPHMQKVFALARERSGSMPAFIRQKIGLTNQEVKCLRDMYLE